MNFYMLIGKLVEAIPEMKQAYEIEIEKYPYEKKLQHVIFGDVLNPFILKELETMNNQSLLERIFSFLERMAVSKSENVRGVLTATVLERIGDDKILLEKARSLMGKETLRLSHEVERNLSRE